MATTITMRCTDCGRERDFTFSSIPPAEHRVRCCFPEPDRDNMDVSVYKRVWTATNIGRVPGAGGSPARSAK